MPSHSSLVALVDGDRTIKLVRVWFGRDGSYYVTSPYHSANWKAAVAKIVVNYDRREQLISFDDTVEAAALDDEDKRLKLSHHADGWIHFSGEGIASGFDESGSPKGIAIKSWPLNSPVAGPSFAVAMCGLERFDASLSPKAQDICFSRSAICELHGANGFILEGYYFPAEMRRFVRVDEAGLAYIDNVHPNGISFELKVVLPQQNCDLQGFLGLHLYRWHVDLGGAPDGFTISTSTSTVRINDEGERVADGLFAVYPRSDGMRLKTSMNWPARPVSNVRVTD